MRLPDDIRTLLRSQDPTRPRLTWYGESPGERIELSGRVLDNWAAKAGNLLQEEFDIEPGSVVRLDLPSGHWRAMYWALATWSLGAAVDVAPELSTSGADVLVAHQPPVSFGLARQGVPLVAVNLEPLARRSTWPASAGGDIDEAEQLSSYGDVLDPLGRARPADPALRGPGGRWTFDALVAPLRQGSRLLLSARQPADVMLRAALSTWAADGSVVITPALPDAELARLAGIEGAEIVDAAQLPADG